MDKLRAEPFRLFFPLGILLGTAGVSHWLLYDLGWISSCSKYLHGGLQIQCFLMAFATGFLFTALPRFMSVTLPSPVELGVAALALTAGALALLLQAWLAAYLFFALLIATIVFFGARRFPKRQNTPPKEFVFIPIGLAHGLIGALFQILYWAGKAGPFWSQLGWLMITQGVFLCLVMGIGGFLGPRLLGHQLFRIEGGRPVTPMTAGNSRVVIHAIAGLLLFSSFILEALGRRVLGCGLRALVVSVEVVATNKIYKLPSGRDTYVKLFWTSFWMIILGLWAQTLWPSYRMAALHLVFIGGFSLMTFCIATMVSLSHLGYGTLLKTPLWVVSLFGATLLMAMVVRSSADFHPRFYFHFLAAGSVLWLIAAFSWLFFVVPKFFRAPASLDQPSHEETCGRS